MANEKSLVEEAIIQMKNLEEAVAENAKGILASTMSREIKELVKESLTEQDDDEIETDIDVEGPEGSEDIADIEMDSDELEDEGDDTDMDNMDMDMDDEDMDDEDMEDMDDEDMDDEDTIDLTDADDEEVLRVFQLMGPDDNIVVTKDDKGNTHLKDEETGKEYMIVGEGEEEEMDESWDEEMEESYDEEMNESDEEEMDESIESIVERMFSSDDEDEMDEEMYESDDEDMDEEIVYEIEMDEEEEMDEQVEDSIYESKISTIKPKGVGMGKPKFSYDSKPNQGEGFKTKMKEGPKTMGTGKAKFTYKDGENAGSKLSKNKMVKKSETKEGSTVKKTETKEASRTLGNGSAFRKGGLPKQEHILK